MTMREKIARAMFQRAPMSEAVPYEGLTDNEKHAFERMADAALDALMEPTEGMRAMLRVPCANSDCSAQKFTGFYSDMISAAKDGA